MPFDSDANAFLTRYLQESAAVHLIEVTAEGTVLFCNQTVADTLKLERSAIVGCRVSTILAEGYHRILSERLAGPQRDSKFLLVFVDSAHMPYSLECQLHSRAGAFLLVGEAPPGDERNANEMIRLNNDLATITRENARRGKDLERALNELRDAQAMLVHSEKIAALGQMTAGVAHEINNPLGFVLNNHEMLRQDFTDLLGFVRAVQDCLPALAHACPEVYERLTGKAGEIELDYLSASIPRKLAANLEGLERVNRIVLDLKRFSRLDEPDFKVCDLEDNIRSTLRFLGPLMRSHNVRVEPAFGPVGDIYCCPGALNQAVSNVVINAIQASAPGSKVRVSTGREGAECFITVADEGAGIPPELLQRIFDPFFTTKPAGSGTGLGLSITHQVVASHGGRIQIESEQGRGTTVRIRIPAGTAASGGVH